MSQTYTRLLYHVVFSTKDRAPTITDALKPNLDAYMGGIIKRLGGIPISIGCVEDHVHVLASIRPTISVSDFMRDVKAGSSKWVRDQSLNRSDFEWQRGYAACTVNQSIVDDVIRYIDRQVEHHSKVESADELKRLLELNRAEFDPRFLA